MRAMCLRLNPWTFGFGPVKVREILNERLSQGPVRRCIAGVRQRRTVASRLRRPPGPIRSGERYAVQSIDVPRTAGIPSLAGCGVRIAARRAAVHSIFTAGALLWY